MHHLLILYEFLTCFQNISFASVCKACQERQRRVKGARGRWGISDGCQQEEGKEAAKEMGRGGCMGGGKGQWGFRLKPDD